MEEVPRRKELFDCVRPVEGVLFRRLGKDGVLLRLNSTTYFGLNEVAARFWEIIVESSDWDGIIDRLLVEFEVERAVLMKDIELLVHELEKAELIVVS